MLLFRTMILALVATPNIGATGFDYNNVPDSLYLEVSMKPGYVWMNGCGEMGKKKNGDTVAPSIQPLTSSQADAHASHHPGQGIIQPVSLDTATLEKALAELNYLVNGGTSVSPPD